MKFKNIYFLFLVSVLLSGCIQSTALLGPSVTVATTGNIMHAGFQYGANKAIEKETGKDTLAHLKNVIDEEQENQTIKKKIKNIVKNTIDRFKKNLLVN